MGGKSDPSYCQWDRQKGFAAIWRAPLLTAPIHGGRRIRVGKRHARRGEAALRERIAYGIPDILGRDRQRICRWKTLVIGAGHWAANALLDLARLTETRAGTSFLWATRGTRFRANLSAAANSTGSRRAASLARMVKNTGDSGHVKPTKGLPLLRSAEDDPIIVEARQPDGRAPDWADRSHDCRHRPTPRSVVDAGTAS